MEQSARELTYPFIVVTPRPSRPGLQSSSIRNGLIPDVEEDGKREEENFPATGSLAVSMSFETRPVAQKKRGWGLPTVARGSIPCRSRSLCRAGSKIPYCSPASEVAR